MKRQHFAGTDRAEQTGPKRLAPSSFLDTVLNQNIDHGLYHNGLSVRHSSSRDSALHDVTLVGSDDDDGEVSDDWAGPHVDQMEVE